jgi:hypothetical protein
MNEAPSLLHHRSLTTPSITSFFSHKSAIAVSCLPKLSKCHWYTRISKKESHITATLVMHVSMWSNGEQYPGNIRSIAGQEIPRAACKQYRAAFGQHYGSIRAALSNGKHLGSFRAITGQHPGSIWTAVGQPSVIIRAAAGLVIITGKSFTGNYR